MKKIINPWEGLDGYMCFGCAPSNPMGLHMEFYEDGDDIVAYWEPWRKYELDHAIYGMFVDGQFRTLFVVDINKDEPMVKFCCNKEKYTLGK